MAYYLFTMLHKIGIREIYGINLGDYVYVDGGAKIIDGLYIGSLATATSSYWLQTHNIEAIINISGSDYKTDIPVFRIQMEDAPVMPDVMEDYIRKFSLGLAALKAGREAGKNVLVHCAAGINRSAMVIGFYLIDVGYTYNDTIRILTDANKTRNLPVLTNESFRYLLQAYESFCRNFGK